MMQLIPYDLLRLYLYHTKFNTMKTAIIYCSKHGATRKIAEEMAAGLFLKNVRLYDLNETSVDDLKQYQVVIIGGSIYFGQIQKKIKTFCNENMEILMQKNLGLFISCLTKEQEQEEFDNAFPESLRKHAVAKGLMGGELIYKKLSLLEKIAIKFVGKDSTDVHEINYKAIDEFIEKINAEFVVETKQDGVVS